MSVGLKLEEEKRRQLAVLARQLVGIACRYRQGGENLTSVIEECRVIFNENVKEEIKSLV